MKIEVIIMSA